MKKSNRFMRMVRDLVLIALLCFALNCVSICRGGTIDEKRPADAAIVLGAGSSDQGVSPVFQARIDHGIWLYKNDYVDYLIFTGGVGEGNTHSDAYMAGQYALEHGVPQSSILLEEQSTITQENIKYAKAILDEKQLKTAILVSDPLHMKRAMAMATAYGIEAYSSPTPTTQYQTWKTQLPFLLRESFFDIGYHLYTFFFGLL